MWFGSALITAFEHWLDGIRLAELLYGISEDRRLAGFDFAAFEEWCGERFNPERLSINSFSMARRAAESEADAFGKWFQWYDQFLNETTSDTH